MSEDEGTLPGLAQLPRFKALVGAGE